MNINKFLAMKHIIIVDDRLENRYMLESLLKGVDYRISTAKNGLEALSLARKSLPDLVISDILMPVMDGFTLCKEWRKDELLKKIPFIFYTAAYTSPQDIKYALRLGADRFLIKPQEPSEFLTVIKQVLDEFEKGKTTTKPESEKGEAESLREYNAVLFRKLEDKLIQTEQSDRKLKQYAFELEQNIEKLKLSEENLRQTRDYLDKLINNTNAPVIVWNPQFNIIRFNRAFEHLTGYSAGEVLGQKLDLLFPETSKKESLMQIERTLSGEHWESVEIPVLTKQKEIKIILWNSASIYDREGKAQISTIAQGQNITERKLAEEMMKKNSDRLVRLSECISSLGPDYDLNINQLTALCGELLSARCALYNRLEDGQLQAVGQWQTPPGFKEKDVASGHICYDLISDNRKDIVLINNLSKTSYVDSDPLIRAYALQTYLGKVVMSEAKPVGSLCLFYQSDFRPVDEDRRILGIIGSAIGNEDTRKQLTLALLKSERLLNKTEMISGIGGWEYDVATKLLTWTKEAYRIYGVKKVDPNQPGHPIDLFLDPDQQNMEKAFTNAISRGEPYDLDLRCRTADGSQKWVRMIGTPLFEDGKITKLVGNIVDITERKISEEALKASEAKLKETNITKDKFFSIIAHDLKNPFNGILGFSNILKEEAQEMDLPTIQEYAGMINRSALQVFRLLDNLLSWARIQQDQMPFNPTTWALKEVVFDAVSALISNARNKKITLTNLVSDQVMVTADGDMLKTVLRNLLSNAVKFTPAGGKVEVSATEVGSQVEISVADNGRGMNKESLSRLFKIDAGYSTRGTAEEEGTGLGLILCKEFIEKHGGQISVQSELDKGSIFTFTLPNK
jgi:two-component system, sensor histidine kinase and response regulator